MNRQKSVKSRVLNGDSHICISCIGGDTFLKERLHEALEGALKRCTICGARKESYTIDAIVLIVDEIYRRYVTTVDNLPWDTGAQTPADILRELLDCEDEDLLAALLETLSSREQRAVYHDGAVPMYDATSEIYDLSPGADGYYQEGWDDFVSAVKYRGRFFLDNERAFLKELFDPVIAGDLHQGTPPIIVLGAPDSDIREIYRGRDASSLETRKKILENPPRELAPPPRDLRSAGRLNAAGTLAFYGASDVKTCVAELSIPFGGAAMVGKFMFLRPVRVLDLRLLSRAFRPFSYFDPQLQRKRGYEHFMRGLRDILRRPVLDGADSLEYLPTQMIAEFMAREYHLDGIMFVSSVVSEAAEERDFESSEQSEHARGEADIARKTGINIVLFSHAAVVENDRGPAQRRVLDVGMPLEVGDSDFWWVQLSSEPQVDPPVDDEDPAVSDAIEPTLKLREGQAVLAWPRAINYDVKTSRPRYSGPQPEEEEF